MLASLLHSCDDHGACAIFHKLQEGGLSCLAHSELGSIIKGVRKIVQMNLSLFISDWESDIAIISSHHSSILGDCHSAYHFPNITSNDSCFMLSDIHHLTSLSPDLRQVDEALHPTHVVMACPHYLGMSVENDQTYFSLQDSHRDPVCQIENSPFHRS